MTYGDPHAAPAASHPVASRGEIATPAISLNGEVPRSGLVQRDVMERRRVRVIPA
jgi:hypothetical protein